MPAQLINLMHGSENFQSCSAQVRILALPCEVFRSIQRETFLSPKIHGAKLKQAQAVSCYKQPGYTRELGEWRTDTWEVPDGAILKIYGKVSPGDFKPVRQASKLIQVRAGAPFHEVRIPLTQHPKAMYQHAFVRGRFDLLDYEDLTEAEKIRYGVNVIPPQYRGSYENFAVNKTMQFIVKEAATAAKPIIKKVTVETKEGEKEVTHTQAPRRLQFD